MHVLENDGYDGNTIALVCQQVTFASAAISAKRLIRYIKISPRESQLHSVCKKW